MYQLTLEYILALCDPRETQTLNYKGCQALLNSETIEHIEKQTNAVIMIEGSSAVTITGTALGTKKIQQPMSVSPWSLRLDTSLQKALSQQSDGNSSMTIEDYDNTSASVKRVILHCLNDTATDDIDDDLLFVSNSPTNSQKSSNQFKLPLDLLMGDEQADSANGQHKKQGSDTDFNQIDGRVGNLTQQLTGANISHTEANCAAKPSGALPNSKLSKELEYLRKFGMSVGYSVNIVEEGLKFADENTQVSDFIEILTKLSDSKSEDSSDKGNRSSSPDLEILSPSKNLGNFPPPPPIPSPSKLADMTGRQSLPPEYKSKLIKDFTEEANDLPIEELKRRNEKRQSVLKASFDDENLPKRNTNMSPRGQSRGEKNGHRSNKQKGQGRSQKKKNKQKGRQPGAETPTQYIEIDDSEETCVMEPWKDDIDDDCRIVDISHSNSMPVVVQPKRQQQQQHTNYNRQSYGNNFQQPYGALSSPQRQQTSTGHHQQLQKGPIAGKPDDLRYIVIDGSNVAMTHGNGKIFSCRGIKICIDHFLKRGHKQVTAFVPGWRKYRPRMENPISDQPLLEQLREQGYLVFTPSRRVNGKLISAYDDRFVLELAEREDGVVVSNDQYRDLMKEKASWRILVEDRLLMFTFAGDNFMIPEDPLGQDGPTLDQLLHKPHAGAQKRMAKTLADLKGKDEAKAKPYPTAIIKVKIVKVGHTASFTGSGGESGPILNFSVADPGDAALASLNDSSKFDQIKEGKSIIIRNFMAKNGRIILTKHTKIMTGPPVEISEEMSSKAHILICPPSPVKKIADVKGLPRRSLVTVRGQMIKLVEAPEMVIQGQIEGLSLIGDYIELVVSEDGIYKDLKVNKTLLLQAVKVDPETLEVEETLGKMLPLKAVMTVKSEYINSFELVEEEHDGRRT
ncbi:LOW QUALITY PROTEIN: uncharacterized protein LOC117338610 [Pecten maximus]|uniref:LOW QUALITY PROTEIN: uncharacterized protein LOC117338610 n=1 Tax=Pecten maximus TaxID=6579 RepID=UPI00145851B5|nr:LOW QUALITY PROTEIN: uncharacterized protein LOC117338610 [Pecten maximus]